MIGFLGRLFGPRVSGYKTIDSVVAGKILKAQKANPAMGRQRLQALLATQGVNVNAVELKRFLRDKKIEVAPPTRPVRLPSIPRRKPTQS